MTAAFFLFGAQSTPGVYNVRTYGATGDGSTDDTAAIQAAINAMYASATKGGVVFFPAGTYKVSDSGSGNAIILANSNPGSANTSGIITGSGRIASIIVGTLPNGFIFYQADGTNGPEEISNLGIANSSSTIGSGALLINNTRGRIVGNAFQGMANLVMPSNIYNAKIENCDFGPVIDGTTGATGTFGFAGAACNISACRNTSNFQTAIQVGGSQQGSVIGCSNENPTIGLLVGMNTGWASSCTVAAGVNSAIMNIGGNLGSSTTTQFSDGSEIFMKGLTTVADWGKSPLDTGICSILGSHTTARTITSYTYNSGTGLVTLTMQASQLINPGETVTIASLNIAGLNGAFALASSSGTTITYTGPTGQAGSPTGGGMLTETGLDGSGFAGHYRISRNVSVVSPVPVISRYQASCSSSIFSGYGCEAAHYPIFVMAASDCAFIGCGGSGTPTECVDAFGTTGYTAPYCFYLYNVQGCSFIGCGASNNPATAGWYFDPNKTQIASLISCTSQKQANNITGTSSSISTTVLTVVSLSQSSTIGIGMRVTGSGVSANTVITGNAASDGTLTGAGGTGTYRVNNSQSVSGTAITIVTGDDYSLPSTNAGKTGVELFNTVPQQLPSGYTSGLNSMNRTFTSLPGQAGSNSNIQVTYGMEYDIVDSNTNTWGATVAAGGSNQVRVRYNGTNWTVMGK